MGAEVTCQPLTPSAMTTRDVLLRKSPADGMQEGANAGLKSFFHSGINLESHVLQRLQRGTTAIEIRTVSKASMRTY